MIITTPMPFAAALRLPQVKAILPTELSSRELMDQVDASSREQSFFSAKNVYTDVLSKMRDAVSKILNPQPDENGVTKGLDQATARLGIKDALKEAGYQPEVGKRGSIEDLSSDGRINLVVEQNVKAAQGYGYFSQGQTVAILDQWPAQELFRAESREKPRDWNARWLNAAGEVGDNDAANALRKFGRMVARKDSPIWTALSAFGTPYPPFDFNSGMDVQDVSRSDAEALGVIDAGESVEPQSRPFELKQAA